MDEDKEAEEDEVTGVEEGKQGGVGVESDFESAQQSVSEMKLQYLEFPWWPLILETETTGLLLGVVFIGRGE